MKKSILAAGLCLLALAGCKKNSDTPTDDLKTTEQKALTDFSDKIAIPQYNDLAAKADVLNASIVALNASSTQSNLDAARTAWLDMRRVWEQCEGFLFGPVEDNEYDPSMDTWPTDYVQMDSLLATATPLTENFVQNVTLSLRGFHPIEYIIFGNHGDRLPGGITARQKEYMVSLAADLKSNCHALADSWSATGGNYGAKVKTAGTGSSIYATRKEIFTAMADGMIDICDEVGQSKMQEPYASMDPKTVESPYSGNSVADFRNNITGLENVYLCRYASSGASMANIVALNNAALDSKIRAQITAAISSFANITLPYEQAIVSQRVQIQSTQAALDALKTTLEGELKPYIVQYIKD